MAPPACECVCGSVESATADEAAFVANEVTLESNDEVEDDNGKCGEALKFVVVLVVVVVVVDDDDVDDDDECECVCEKWDDVCKADVADTETVIADDADDDDAVA